MSRPESRLSAVLKAWPAIVVPLLFAILLVATIVHIAIDKPNNSPFVVPPVRPGGFDPVERVPEPPRCPLLEVLTAVE
jgi:hypothetical protein